ncbi:MAG TPA: DUF4389 domain-containing protein [Gaiellales bacterium]|jgi:hypothetical protein|nr:DUF4389 domain-containing protein [Gaiellales bacterium]
MSTPAYPVRLVEGQDLERSRLTVFFRLFLLIPHVIVLWLYGIAAGVVVIIAWFAGVFTGRIPDGLHDFIVGYLRYSTRVTAYGTILADPFPPFGAGGSYAVDLEIDAPVTQSRLTIFFRTILVIPCYVLVAYALQPLLGLIAIGNWFVALFTGRVPEGLQRLGLFCLRFNTRTLAYFFLVNPRYPAFGDTPASLPANQRALPPLP